MKNQLAGGHENGQETPATAMPDADPIALSEVPLIAELEAMIAAGKGWSKEFEKRVDEVSIALFGVTEADTRPPEPDAAQFTHARTGRVDDAALMQARVKHWEASLWCDSPTEQEFGIDGLLDWWEDRSGVDVTDDTGEYPLRCLVNIQRQLRASLSGHYGARLTLDGTGIRGKAGAEAWGAAIAADAAKFRSGWRG